MNSPSASRLECKGPVFRSSTKICSNDITRRIAVSENSPRSGRRRKARGERQRTPGNVSQKLVSPRRGRRRKARGERQRTPGNESQKLVSPRSGRRRKARGERKRTPGNESQKLVSPRSGRRP